MRSRKVPGQASLGPSWFELATWILGGIVTGLTAFGLGYWWFSSHASDDGKTTQYDIVRSAIAATGVITVGAGAAVALRRQKAGEAQLALEQDANRTDRYMRAVEQLGSASIHIRLGGIYALERLGSDSRRDLPTIIEVLAAFVRATTLETRKSDDEFNNAHDQAEPLQRTRPSADVEAAVTVLGRLNARPADEPRIDLTEAYLPKARLAHVNLAHTNLNRANLDYADLTLANFASAILVGANLDHANLIGAVMTQTNLGFANANHAALDGADLSNAILMGAELTQAGLTHTNLASATLNWADLTGAFLPGADLTDARLGHVIWSETLWPDQFVPPPSAPPSESRTGPYQ